MKPHAIGILFVHGIGDHPEGETLTAFGDPLVRWLSAWLSRPGSEGLHGRVQPELVRLAPSRTLSTEPEPPHAQLRMELIQDGDAQPPCTWLMAESWWGGQVQRPAFSKVAGWMITVGAWIMLSHATKWGLARRTKVARVAVQLLALALWIPLSLLFQISVLLISVLALLPLPRLRSALSGALLALTGILGDSYVLTESDLQRAAIVGKTRQALTWLAARCKTVVVIAHSQGAAVAHHALRVPEPENVSALLTFGSGLQKLEELLGVREGGLRINAVARILPIVFLLLALIGYILYFEPPSKLAEVSVVFLGCSLLLALTFAVVSAREHWQAFADWARGLSLTAARPGLRRWIDVYASHDPVPNGPLAPPGVEIAGLRSREIWSTRSMLHDHTTYLANRAEFLPCVVAALSEAAGGRWLAPSDEQAFEQASLGHRRSVRLWIATGLAMRLAAVLVFVLSWSQLAPNGGRVLELLEGLGADVVPPLRAMRRVLCTVLPFVSAENARNLGFRILGASPALLALVAYRQAYAIIWRWWDGVHATRLFSPKHLASPADRIFIASLMVAAGLAPLIVVGGWRYFTGIAVGHVLGGLFLSVYAIMLIAKLRGTAAQLPSLSQRVRAREPGAWRAVWDELKELLVVGFFATFMFGQALPVFPGLSDFLVGLLIAAVLFGQTMRWHVRLLERAQAIGSLTQRVVLIAPIALGVAMALAKLLAVIPSAPGGDRDHLADPLFTGLGMYWLVLLLLLAALKLLERGRRKHPAT